MSGSTKLMTPGGGGLILTPASNIASDVTVNIPPVNGTLVNTGSTAQVSQSMLASGVAGNGPAFFVYLATAQAIGLASDSPVAMTSVVFDTASRYNATGSAVGGIPAYSFLPNVAGYYQIDGQVNMGSSALGYAFGTLYKNGASYIRGGQLNGTATAFSSTVSAIIYFNGTTDYITLYGQIGTGTSPGFTTGTAPYNTYLSGCLVRSA